MAARLAMLTIYCLPNKSIERSQFVFFKNLLSIDFFEFLGIHSLPLLYYAYMYSIFFSIYTDLYIQKRSRLYMNTEFEYAP